RLAIGGRAKGRPPPWQWLVQHTTAARLSVGRGYRAWPPRRLPGKSNNRLSSGTNRAGTDCLLSLSHFSREIIDLSLVASSRPTSPSSWPVLKPAGAAT